MSVSNKDLILSFLNHVFWVRTLSISLRRFFKAPPNCLQLIDLNNSHFCTNNVVCATSKASDLPAHTRSLIRAFASRLSIL